MKIEAVVVSVNYGDFLAETLPQNLQHIDRIVVVTHWNDKETQAVCSKYSVECVQTDVFHHDGDKFNKGRGINLGLGHLRGLDWILHLDSDIVLPSNFRGMMARTHLDKQNLYGCDRVNLHSYEEWAALKPHLHDNGYMHKYFVEPPKAHRIGARIIHHEHGYCPIGYFQLWHNTMGKRYPLHQGNAEHSDVLFAAQWSRFQRILLPEVFVYHLESEPCGMGANWNGRKTKRFGPSHHHHKHPYQPKAP